MQCINSVCQYRKTLVINSRKSQHGKGVLRRRHCPKCYQRYTTVEVSAYSNYPNKQDRAAIRFLFSKFANLKCIGKQNIKNENKKNAL
jgi:transcriptional regulator NrdR family protein